MGGGTASKASSPPTSSSSAGVSKTVKAGLLIVLCLQNAVYTMHRRYSVGVLNETWSSSSVLMAGEVIKLVFSTVMTLADSGSTSAEGTGVRKLTWLVRASPPMCIPAVVFFVMNLLSYVSLKRVDASTFTVCAQMKILTTAIFSVVLMGRSFHARKWRALVLLVLGVTLVSNGSYVSAGKEDKKGIGWQYVIGVAAVLAEVSLSGFVSVFFEKVLKSRVVNLSVWDRNFQLAMYSIVFYLPMALWEEGPLFQGWTVNAGILSVLGSAGGILVALTMKYTDAVLKTFATSGAIIVTAVGGHFTLGSPLDIPIGVGAGCTVLSLLNYSDDGAPVAAPDTGSGGGSNGTVAAKGSLGGDAEDEAGLSLLTRTGAPSESAA
ncbi:unnamed protein product [Ectocarpus sp. 4 AP-2014]